VAGGRRYAELSARSSGDGHARSLEQPRRWKEATRGQSDSGRAARRESSRQDKISGKEAALMPRNRSRYRNASSDRRHVAPLDRGRSPRRGRFGRSADRDAEEAPREFLGAFLAERGCDRSVRFIRRFSDIPQECRA